MSTIKVGLVGFGSWGKRHYESWKQIPHVEVVGIYDLAYSGRLAHSSLESLLDIVDAIDIVVPANSLAQVAMRGLKSAKHVMIEKPMSTSLNQARELVRIADSHKEQIAMVGFIERFNPVFVKLRSIIEKLQAPGKIFCQRSGSPTLVSRSTGVLKDLAVHDLDLLRWYLGEPSNVTIRSKDAFYMSQVEASFENVEALVISDCLGPKIRRWVLTYSQDNIFAYFENNRWRLYMNNVEVPIGWHMPLQRELEYFVECIREGRAPSPSVRDGLRVLEILEKAQIAD